MNRTLTALLLFLSVLSYAQQIKPLQFREETFDFGSVREEGGSVMHEFTFTNVSSRPVKILKVQASCGCTTPDWSKEPVLPGKTGFIQAKYDPKGRPGYFNKSLTVTTDFDSDPVVLQIKGQVETPGSVDVNEFRAAKGAWRLKVSSFNMGKVFLKDEFVTKEFPVLNSGDKPVSVQRVVGPSYIKAEVDPRVLSPGQTGTVKISYNGKQKGLYGFQSDNVEFHTDDGVMSVKSFSVYATLEDYFPKLSAEELTQAPVLKIADVSFDLGRIKQERTVTREVSIVNEGKKDLVIKSLQGNCSCVSAAASKETLKSREAATISISFNPQDRKGTQQKAVTVYSNDPRNPVQRITFTAYVED